MSAPAGHPVGSLVRDAIKQSAHGLPSAGVTDPADDQDDAGHLDLIDTRLGSGFSQVHPRLVDARAALSGEDADRGVDLCPVPELLRRRRRRETAREGQVGIGDDLAGW